MRTLKEIRGSWQSLLDISVASFYNNIPMQEDEAEGAEALLAIVRVDEADSRNCDAMAWRRGMVEIEKGHLFLAVRHHKRLLGVLEEVVCETSLPDGYSDKDLAIPLIRTINFSLTRACIFSGFVLNLAKTKQWGRVWAILNTVDFGSPLVQFQTGLSVAKLQDDPPAWSIVRGMADGLEKCPGIHKKHFARARAYLAIFGEKHEELDLFVAKQTAHAAGIGAEEAALIYLEVYSATHNSEDLESFGSSVRKVDDLGRRGALLEALSCVS